jgi:hypothetical protein
MLRHLHGTCRGSLRGNGYALIERTAGAGSGGNSYIVSASGLHLCVQLTIIRLAHASRDTFGRRMCFVLHTYRQSTSLIGCCQVWARIASCQSRTHSFAAAPSG